MSLEVSIAVIVGDGDSRYVSLQRTETVIPPVAIEDDAQATADLLDLGRRVAYRLITDVQTQTEEQLLQLRDLLTSSQ